MRKLNGYDEVQVFTGDYETIRLGGHVCKVINVKIEETRTGKEMLVVAFDIEEGENKGFYQRRFEQNKKNNTNAKYPGVYRLVLDDSNEINVKSFKQFITSVENSNEGFKWTWEESHLVGKLFGGVFGREEFQANDGSYKFVTKLRWTRSIKNIEDVEAPNDKLINKNTSGSWDDMVPVSDNDMPF